MHARNLLLAGIALAGAAQAAEISIYKQPNFGGGEARFNQDMPNLQGSGVYDQSKSIRVDSGSWQACSQPNYQGDCLVLQRGEYASLPQQLNGRIESLREVTQVAQAPSRWTWSGGDWRERENWRERGWRDHVAMNDDNRSYERRYGYEYGGRGAISFFADGNATRFSRDVDNLRGSQFADGADRMLIREGVWEVCAFPGYRACRTYEPGTYTNGRFNTQIGSIRRGG